MSRNKFFRSAGNFPFVSLCPYNFADKENAVEDYILYMLDRTQSMFTYDGLPETIPQGSLELYLQMNGNTGIAEYEGKLYAFTGGLGGEPNPYYLPTIYTVANPALRLSRNFRIGEDCVVIKSDTWYMGLLPMFRKYATAMAENDLTMHIADINSRITALLSASDDRTKRAAEKYIADIADGQLGVIAETAFLDGLKSQPYAGTGTTNQITQLIELQQYLKASWFNELGLNANYNMKRESINSDEAQLNEDALLPLIDDMLSCREQGVEEVNRMFGTNISVKLNSAWEVKKNELLLPPEGETDSIDS